MNISQLFHNFFEIAKKSQVNKYINNLMFSDKSEVAKIFTAIL